MASKLGKLKTMFKIGRNEGQEEREGTNKKVKEKKKPSFLKAFVEKIRIENVMRKERQRIEKDEEKERKSLEEERQRLKEERRRLERVRMDLAMEQRKIQCHEETFYPKKTLSLIGRTKAYILSVDSILLILFSFIILVLCAAIASNWNQEPDVVRTPVCERVKRSIESEFVWFFVEEFAMKGIDALSVMYPQVGVAISVFSKVSTVYKIMKSGQESEIVCI